MIQAILVAAPGWAVSHAPALLIVLPLILAPVMALMPNGRMAWALSIAAAALGFWFALILYGLVQDSPSGILSYALGRWAPPLGIEFRIDALNGLMLLLVTFISLLTSIFSWPAVSAEIRKQKQAMMYCLMTLASTGFAGVAITGDAFNLFVFLEVCSISVYGLVALGAGRDRRALPAAFNYLVMGTIGASFYVIGLGFLYAATGTLNMADLAERLPELMSKTSVQAGFAFILVGLGLKAAMWPLHQWLPNAYAYAPSAVTVLLSATATKVALYALLRFLFTVLDTDAAYIQLSFVRILMPLAIAGIVCSSVLAVFQNDVRRMLAYSSVAQAGLILLGVSMATVAGVSAGLFHLTAHALLKAAMFMAVGGIVITYEGTKLSDFAGLGRSAPWTMTAFTIAGASLIGLPLTLGFQTKLQLGYALFERGWMWGLGALIAGSLLALVYVGRVVMTVFFDPPSNTNKVRSEAPWLILGPLWALALLNIYFGIAAAWPVSLTDAAARAALMPGAAP